MMTQSVNAQTAKLMGNAAGSTTSKGKQAGKGFDLIIGNNLKVFQNVNADTDNLTGKKASLQKKDVTDTDKNDKTDLKANQTKDALKASSADSSKAADSMKDTKSDTTNTIDANEETKDEAQDPAVDNQLLAQISGMLQSIQEAVMNTLNLSPEELNQLLTDQGMTITDLLQPENLQQLILANSGQSDILSVLTDENLAAQMNDLLNQVNDIISEADLGMSQEQIDAILAQANQRLQEASRNDAVAGSAKDSSGDDNSLEESEVSAAGNTTDKQDASLGTGDAKETTTENASLKEAKNSGSSTQEDNARHDRKDMKAEDQFQNFVDNLVKTTKDSDVNFAGNVTQASQIREIANQIIDRIKVSVTADNTSMELQLNPENLGKVNLTVQSKNGVMTAQFVVQNQVTKEAIESQMQTLRDTLSNQGIKVEAIEVTVADYNFNPNGQGNSQNETDSQKNQSGKKITLEEAMNMTEDIAEEASSDVITGDTGNQIDYTA